MKPLVAQYITSDQSMISCKMEEVKVASQVYDHNSNNGSIVSDRPSSVYFTKAHTARGFRLH